MEGGQVFPFEYVKKDSKVIIFGLGQYGKSYIEQVNVTKWCEIVGISDSNLSKRIRGYHFIPIYQLKENSADYIIIAISTMEMVHNVYVNLIKQGISDSKIISTLDRTEQDYKHMPMELHMPNRLQILLWLGGGLGDYVVYLSVYKRIISLCDNIEIDLKCRKKYGEVLYENRESIRFIFDVKEEVDSKPYDLVLYIEQGIHVLKYVKERCDKFSYILSKKIQLLQNAVDSLDEDILETQYRFAILIRRAILKGWNIYGALGHGSVLDLSADMVHISLEKYYQSKYLELGLEKYITVNRGADKLPLDNRTQTKVWPYKYYQQLVMLFKAKYPQYEIVQLGDNDAEQIKGVDRCIKGQNLELVKYILHGAALHIDCEGGLVHLATALGTKCAVLFGPTPVEYYGYPQNINIVAKVCRNCMSLTKNWYIQCPRGEKEPECMYSITPELVYRNIAEYMDGKVTQDF